MAWSEHFWKFQVAKICTVPARESDSEFKIVENSDPRTTFGSWSRQNLTAPARERFGSQNHWKLRASDDFWKLKSPKFAPRLRARAIWKSKSLKHQGLGTFFEVQSWFKALLVWQAQGFRHSIPIEIAQTYCNSEAKRLLNMWYFREVSQNNFSQSVRQSVSQSVSQSVR